MARRFKPTFDDPPMPDDPLEWKMEFGKHEGEQLDSIPDSYLEWVLDNVDTLSDEWVEAIKHRLHVLQVDDPTFEERCEAEGWGVPDRITHKF